MNIAAINHNNIMVHQSLINQNCHLHVRQTTGSPYTYKNDLMHDIDLHNKDYSHRIIANTL